jgi:hypothetical protein
MYGCKYFGCVLCHIFVFYEFRIWGQISWGRGGSITYGVVGDLSVCRLQSVCVGRKCSAVDGVSMYGGVSACVFVGQNVMRMVRIVVRW